MQHVLDSLKIYKNEKEILEVRINVKVICINRELIFVVKLLNLCIF